MTPSIESQWGAEIREFLVAAMSRQRTVGFLTHPAWQSASPSPIGRWSILEGKVYPSIGGNLVEKLDEALRLIELVDSTFNPRMRLSERMEGPVDWGATLSRRPFGIVPEYVIRSSGIGLSEHERCALWGWVGWIADKASIYGLEDDAGNLIGGGWSFLWKKEALCRLRNLATDPRCKWAYGRGGDLRRWSHVARRSRWPLLRDLVAESLRIELEPWSIEKIPLPEKRERLFELLCVVRVLKALGEVPGDVRWLGEFDSNQKKCDGLSFYYQKPIPWEHIRKHPLYGDGLDAVLKGSGISGLTYRIDCVFEFDKPRNGIDGILIEAKSGEQKFTDAVDQMVLYRALHERRPGTRWLFWGITEDTSADHRIVVQDRTEPSKEATEHLDQWAFSSADGIGPVVRSLGLS